MWVETGEMQSGRFDTGRYCYNPSKGNHSSVKTNFACPSCFYHWNGNITYYEHVINYPMPSTVVPGRYKVAFIALGIPVSPFYLLLLPPVVPFSPWCSSCELRFKKTIVALIALLVLHMFHNHSLHHCIFILPVFCEPPFFNLSSIPLLLVLKPNNKKSYACCLTSQILIQENMCDKSIYLLQYDVFRTTSQKLVLVKRA